MLIQCRRLHSYSSDELSKYFLKASALKLISSIAFSLYSISFMHKILIKLAIFSSAVMVDTVSFEFISLKFNFLRTSLSQLASRLTRRPESFFLVTQQMWSKKEVKSLKVQKVLSVYLASNTLQSASLVEKMILVNKKYSLKINFLFSSRYSNQALCCSNSSSALLAIVWSQT